MLEFFIKKPNKELKEEHLTEEEMFNRFFEMAGITEDDEIYSVENIEETEDKKNLVDKEDNKE